MKFTSKILWLLISITIIDFLNALEQEIKDQLQFYKNSCEIDMKDENNFILENECNLYNKRTLRQGLTEEEENAILKLHNEFRRKIAAGNETRGATGPQPAAKYMPDLVWDADLALYAQLYANRCDNGWKCETIKYGKFFAEVCEESSNCVKIDQFGLNVAHSPDTSDDLSSQTDIEHFKKIVRNWYDEVFHWKKENQTFFIKEGLEQLELNFSHFTQIVWAETTRIGCGAVIYAEKESDKTYYDLMCYYSPSGNIPGQPIYEPIQAQ